jgi:hypothetical protein
MAMKLIETAVLETTVRMRYSDNADPEKAKEWFEFEAPIAPLTLPTGSGEVPLGKLHSRYLASIQLAALRYVRDAIGAETQRLAGLVSH